MYIPTHRRYYKKTLHKSTFIVYKELYLLNEFKGIAKNFKKKKQQVM